MDIASLVVGILGLIVSLSGFTIAVRQIRRTRTAAEHAEEAAVKAREVVLRGISTADLRQAHAMINELKRLHRIQDLDQAIEIYNQLTTLLQNVESNLPEDILTAFDDAYNQLANMEEVVDMAVSTGDQSKFDAATFNRNLSNIQRAFNRVRVTLERQTSSP